MSLMNPQKSKPVLNDEAELHSICISRLVMHACPRGHCMSSGEVCMCIKEHRNIIVSRLQSDGQGGAFVL